MNVTPPEPPKIELVKEDYNPIKALQGPHSAHSIKARYENYTASYINNDQMATILIKYNDKTIAILSRLSESSGRTFTIDEAELDDLEGIYKFLKQRKIKYKKI
mgnify:CR=1 FL=1